MNYLKRKWKLFLATFHLSDDAVCEMSEGRGIYNCFHDYCDSVEKVPLHFHLYTCERCGKRFSI